MEMNKFYKSVEDIVLFPGTLEELNEQEKLNKSGNVYQLMPKKDSERSIRGLIIPDMKFQEELMSALFKASSVLGDVLDDRDKEEIFGYMNECYKDIQGLDIRLRAKKIGANGLIHLSYDGVSKVDYKSGISISIQDGSGLPVRLKNKP